MSEEKNKRGDWVQDDKEGKGILWRMTQEKQRNKKRVDRQMSTAKENSGYEEEIEGTGFTMERKGNDGKDKIRLSHGENT